jgi:hypothetical protein
MTRRLTALISLVAALSAFAVVQPGAALAAGSAAPNTSGVSFTAVAEDAHVLKQLLAVQNLIVADGAREIPSARPLARRIERRDNVMQRLCRGIIADAAKVAKAEQSVRPAKRTARASAISPQHADLVDVINKATADVKRKMDEIRAKGDNISVVEMFEMQMLMNHLAQLSEMSTSVMSASNTAIQSMARNIKS